MNIVMTTSDEAISLRETAFAVALAYLVAFVCALNDHIERLVGHSEYTSDDLKKLMPPGDPQWNALWRAKLTVERASQLARDTEYLRIVTRDCPQLTAVAEDYAKRLLAECNK